MQLFDDPLLTRTTHERPAKRPVAPRTTLATIQPLETRSVPSMPSILHSTQLSSCLSASGTSPSIGDGMPRHADRRWASAEGLAMHCVGRVNTTILHMLCASDLYRSQCANLDESGGAKRCRKYLTMYSGAQLTAVVSSTRQRKSNDRMKLKSAIQRRDECQSWY